MACSCLVIWLKPVWSFCTAREKQTTLLSLTTRKTTDKTTDKTYSGVKEVILRAMQSSPSITIEELSVICHLSQDGVRYHIKYLKSEGIIRRVGKKGGYWEILK